MNFFFENLSLVPETSAAMEHFKLVFGSGTSDLAKIRPLKNRDPAITWKHRTLWSPVSRCASHGVEGNGGQLGLWKSALFSRKLISPAVAFWAIGL